MYLMFTRYLDIVCLSKRASIIELSVIQVLGVGVFPCTLSLSHPYNCFCRSSSGDQVIDKICGVTTIPDRPNTSSSFSFTWVKWLQTTLCFLSAILQLLLSFSPVTCFSVLVYQCAQVPSINRARKPEEKVVPISDTHIVYASISCEIKLGIGILM